MRSLREKESIAQKTTQPILCPMQGAADRRAADSTLLRDLRLRFSAEVNRQKYIALQFGQLRADHTLHSPHLNRSRQTDIRVMTGYIFHCGKSPFHSSVRSALPARGIALKCRTDRRSHAEAVPCQVRPHTPSATDAAHAAVCVKAPLPEDIPRKAHKAS